MAGKSVSAGQLLLPFRRLRAARPASFYEFPDRPMESDPRPRLDPGLQLGSQSIPSSLERARLPARRRDRRPLRRLHPRIRRRRQGLGPPLLPALQLGDERQLVPLVGGRQRQPPGRVRRRLAPRARHLRRGRRRPTRPGSGAPTSTRTTSCRTSPRSTPATPTSTGPASTATTGAPTRPRPTGWRSFDQLFSRPTSASSKPIAPAKPLMIGEIGSTEYGGSKAAWIADALDHGPGPNTRRSAACSGSRSSTTAWTGRSRPPASAAAAFAAGIQRPGLRRQQLTPRSAPATDPAAELIRPGVRGGSLDSPAPRPMDRDAECARDRSSSASRRCRGAGRQPAVAVAPAEAACRRRRPRKPQRHGKSAKKALPKQRRIYWGAWIGDQLTGEPAALGHVRGQPASKAWSARASRCSSSPRRSPTAASRPASSIDFPTDAMDRRPQLRRDPVLQLGLAVDRRSPATSASPTSSSPT